MPRDLPALPAQSAGISFKLAVGLTAARRLGGNYHLPQRVLGADAGVCRAECQEVSVEGRAGVPRQVFSTSPRGGIGCVSSHSISESKELAR